MLVWNIIKSKEINRVSILKDILLFMFINSKIICNKLLSLSSSIRILQYVWILFLSMYTMYFYKYAYFNLIIFIIIDFLINYAIHIEMLKMYEQFNILNKKIIIYGQLLAVY